MIKVAKCKQWTDLGKGHMEFPCTIVVFCTFKMISKLSPSPKR